MAEIHFIDACDEDEDRYFVVRADETAGAQETLLETISEREARSFLSGIACAFDDRERFASDVVKQVA